MLHQGERIAWDEFGSGPSILLLHSLGGCGAMWDEVVTLLAPDYRCITLDAPGHGMSPLGSEAFSVTRYAGAALAVLDAAGVTQTMVVGCSMGGHAAQRLALDHPARVLRLVLANTSAGGTDAAVAASRLAATSADHAAKGDQGFALAYVRSRLRPDAAPGLAERYAGWVVPTLPRAYLEALADITRQDFRERLPALAKPTLVVTGTADVSTPPDTAGILAGLIPGARLAVLDGAGHFAPLDSAPAVAALLREFLA